MCAFNLKLFHYLNQILGFDVTADTLQRLRWIALLAKSIWWQVQCINPCAPSHPPHITWVMIHYYLCYDSL